jgi:hypothetical protein
LCERVSSARTKIWGKTKEFTADRSPSSRPSSWLDSIRERLAEYEAQHLGRGEEEFADDEEFREDDEFDEDDPEADGDEDQPEAEDDLVSSSGNQTREHRGGSDR